MGVKPVFGTDGVRGLAFAELDEVVCHAIGNAANRALFTIPEDARWVIGRDTRVSGPALSRALAAGLRAAGADVIDLGVAPTPVVAFAAQHLSTAGSVISASHNPWYDNGVKLFGPGGAKLSDAEQAAVALRLDDLGLTHADRPSVREIARRPQSGAGFDAATGTASETGADTAAVRAAGTAVPATQRLSRMAKPRPERPVSPYSIEIGNKSGKRQVTTREGAPIRAWSQAAGLLEAYERSLRDAIDGRTLDGLRLIVDGANGASASLAPVVLRRLGAQVASLFCEPDGRNINDGCGSVHPTALQAAVTDQGADLGLAFDGDGDRLIAVDCDGGLINGDRQMAMFAVDLAERGLLAGNTLVVTVMSNLGLRRAMAAAGIDLEETAVGDRSVLEALDAGGHSLGGEQSGHLIFRHEAATGDGLRSAVHLADLVARNSAAQPERTSAAVSGGPALTSVTSAELARAAMVEAPQVLLNVPAGAGAPDEHTRRAIDELGAAAGPDVRVLVRPSGTEPVIRVMVEAPAERDATALANRIVELVSPVGAADDAGSLHG